jgi:superfamily II DNA or RNA helicase
MTVDLAELDLGYDTIHFVPIDHTQCLVATLNPQYIEWLRNHFTYKVENYQFAPSYKAGNWDGKIRLLKSDGLMPLGLLQDALDFIASLGDVEKIKTVVMPGVIQKGIDAINLEAIIEKELVNKQTGEEKIRPWDHQMRIAKKMLESRRCVIKAATSSGKSYAITIVAKYLIHMGYIKKCLVIVPKTDLVVQTTREMVNYGYNKDEVGMYFGEVKDEDKEILIATWQSLQNIEDDNFFSQFDLVIGDEIHLAGSGGKDSKGKRENPGTKIKKILDKCVNASWRFGLTGTLPDEVLDKQVIIGALGPVMENISAKELMDSGHITPIKIIIPFITYKDDKEVKRKIKELYDTIMMESKGPKNDTAKFNAEKQFIESYLPRFRYMVDIVNRRLAKKENILILVNTVDYGNKLKKIFEKLCVGYKMVEYISGEMNTDIRKDIRDLMEKETGCVVIATTSLFSTGISVKNLHVLLLTNCGKSKVSVLQSLGRAMRKHESKEVATIIDMVDDLKYSALHSAERLQYYADENFDYQIINVEI